MWASTMLFLGLACNLLVRVHEALSVENCEHCSKRAPQRLERLGCCARSAFKHATKWDYSRRSECLGHSKPSISWMWYGVVWPLQAIPCAHEHASACHSGNRPWQYSILCMRRSLAMKSLQSNPGLVSCHILSPVSKFRINSHTRHFSNSGHGKFQASMSSQN